MKRLFESSNRSQLIYGAIIVLICLLGVSLRLREYLFNKSFWLDEAYLALNLSQQSFSELLQYQWGTPIGFLWLSKTLTVLLGNGEFVLRFIPFVSSIFSIPLFYYISTKYLNGRFWIILATLLFVLSDRLLYFSSEFKPYSSDVLLCLIIAALGTNLINNPQARGAITFGIAAAISILFSFPSLFVTIAILCIYVLKFSLQKDKKQLLIIITPLAIILVSYVLFYFLFLRTIHDNSNLIQFWGNAFLPIDNPLGEVTIWVWNQIRLLYVDPASFRIPMIAIAMSIFGMINLYRKNIFTGLLAIVILAGLFLASGLTIYPFSSRLLLFFVPFIFIWIAAGFELWSNWLSTSKYFHYIIAATAIILACANSIQIIQNPHTKEEIKPLLATLENRWIPGDRIYLYYNASYAFRYYEDLFHLDFVKNNYQIGIASRNNPQLYLGDLDTIRKQERTWLLFTHVYRTNDLDEREFMLSYVDTFAELVESYTSPEGYLYLYSPY